MKQLLHASVFLKNFPFDTPNQKYSGVFRGYKIETLTRSELSEPDQARGAYSNPPTKKN